LAQANSSVGPHKARPSPPPAVAKTHPSAAMGNACCAAADKEAVEVAPLETAQEKAAAEPTEAAVAPAAEEKKEEQVQEQNKEEVKEEVKEEKMIGLTITFLQEGKEVPITFPKQPLGLTFDSNTSPVVIRKLPAGGQGEALGVKAGMQIKAIGGAEVTAMKYEEILKRIKDGAASLPSA